MNSTNTMKDVAELAGVSVASVSRYLNGKTNHLSEATANKVAIAIKRLNYVPNESARQLITKKSKMIAVLVADVNDYFSTEIFKGISSILRENDYTAVLLDSNNDLNLESKTLHSISNKQIFGGVILQPLNTNLKLLEKVISSSLSLVMLDREIKDSPWPSIVTNNYEMSRNASRYFKSLGMKKVAIITNSIDNISTRDQRLKGIKEIYGDETILINPGNTIESFDEAYAKLKHYIIKNPKTLIFALKERWLLEFLPKLIRDNLINDNSTTNITGFSDTNLISNIAPSIKVIKQDPFSIGVNAAKILIESISSGKRNMVKKVEIPARF